MDEEETPERVAARAKAEARRQRILAKSKERMDRVAYGEQPKKAVAEPAPAPAPVVAVSEPESEQEKKEIESGNVDGVVGSAGAVAEESGAIAAATAATPEPAVVVEKAKGSAGAARLKAMRRRRKAKKEEAAAVTAESSSTNVSSVAGEAKEGSEKEISETIQTPSTEDAAATTTTAPTQSRSLPVEEQASSSTAAAPKTASDAPKKKYRGVAKTRWDKVQKKKQEKLEAESKSTSTEKDLSHVSLKDRTKDKSQKNFPIIINLVMIFLLLIVGVDIGWQKFSINNTQTVIETNIAPFQRMGIGSSANRKLTAPIDNFSDSESTKGNDLSSPVVEDEFYDDENGSIEGASKIDPLFRVDLDKLLTQQAGGILYYPAKLAIEVHKSIMYFCYYLPYEIMMSVLTLPSQILLHPPILCITALLLRQILKSILLGKSSLPTLDGDDIRSTMSGAESKGGSDIFDNMKNSALNMVKGMFPRVIGFYETWRHLRADMYVMICGVMIGATISTYYNVIGEAGGDGVANVVRGDGEL